MIHRSSISSRLAQKFLNDYTAVMKHYKTGEEIELTKFLQNVFSIYLAGEENEVAKIKWMKDELEGLRKKYGKNFKAYHSGQLHQYFHFDIVLMKVYTTEEFNNLEEQSLTEQERKGFLFMGNNALQHSLDELYLESEPEEAITSMGSTTATGKTKASKYKRGANDKHTCLSQEQTVLLIHYLKQEKVLLKDEYLSDLDAGRAFEILTGYSQHTLRQNLSKFHLYQTPINLKEIDHLLTRLKIAIGKTLKEK